MNVFVETRVGPVGSTFSFDLSHSNKVFDIKKRIERSQGIPVSMQRLFFNGVELVADHYQLSAYRIVSNSRLLLLLRDSHVNRQMHHQRSPSVARNNQDQGPPSHARESFLNPDLSTMARSNPVPQTHESEAFYYKDRLVSNKGQVLHQPEESVIDSFSLEEYLERAPEPWRSQDIRKLQGFWPGTPTGDNVNAQESLRRNSKNQDLLQSEPSLPSNTFGDFSFGEDLTNIQTEHSTVFQTEHSPVQSNSTEERINAQEPQQKMTVIMTQCGSEYLVEVNASDNVEVLRKEQEEKRKYQLDLPAKGYFFYHKKRVLEDDKSFHWNRVAHGDIIEIFPGPITHEDYHT